MTVLLLALAAIAAGGLVQCILAPSARQRWAAYLQQNGIAVDQLLNALIPPFISLSYADETLSARTFRAARRGKRVGMFMLPIIDFMFRWQGFPNHCEMAYQKEMERRNLPPEYREAAQKGPT